jgi:hypothetical protein
MASVGEIPHEMRQQAAQYQQQHLEREHRAMLEAIPEWSDKEVFDRDRASILEVGHEYGFSDDEVGQIMDHRVVKFMRDYARMANRLKEAEKLPEQVKRASVKGQKRKQAGKVSALDQKLKQAIGSKDENVKLDMIDQLLRG